MHSAGSLGSGASGPAPGAVAGMFPTNLASMNSIGAQGAIVANTPTAQNMQGRPIIKGMHWLGLGHHHGSTSLDLGIVFPKYIGSIGLGVSCVVDVFIH